MTVDRQAWDAWAKMGPGVEFDLIRRMAATWGDLVQHAGDDAAILDVAHGARLVASTDSSVEGVHFRREWLSLQEIGYRATVAALSDLAAMGADPIGLLIAATIPAGVAETIEMLADGIGQAARDSGCPIVGGDLTGGDRISLTMTVLGTAQPPIGRGGAQIGDGVWVTGRLGGPGAAVRALLSGELPSAEHWPRFAHPVARIAEARWLADQGISAMIDISDGLSSDARHVAAASGVALEIDILAIPCIPDVTPRAACASGEEYELLLTAPDEFDVAEFESRFGIPLTRVGTVVEGTDGEVTFLEDGARVDLAQGYDHFSA
jgi:thiamine-monophosphate kinase